MIAETLVTLVGLVLVLIIMRHVIKKLMTERPMIALAAGAAFVLTLILVFVSFITFQTLYPYDLPLQVVRTHNSIAYIEEDGETLFRYARDFKVTKVFTANINRRIDCAVGLRTHIFDLPGVTREYAVGEYNMLDQYAMFPYPLQVGTKCTLHTSVSWSPNFSMSARLVELPPIEYEVEAKPSISELLKRSASPNGDGQHSGNL